jgi:FkbM family methyltransferase
MRLPLSLAAAVARLLPAPLKKAIYRLGPLARLIRRALNRAAPQGLSRAVVAAGGLQGASLLLDLQIEKDYWLGTYEVELQEAVRQWIQPGMTVYDVGANVGYISLLLARHVGAEGQVYAFEPLPANQERIRRNLALNQPAGGKPSAYARVTPVAAAVVDRPGPVRFLTHASTSMGKAMGSAGRADERYLAEIEVAGLTLDEFAYGEGGHGVPQAIKMDIEGGEVLALGGMVRLLCEARPLLLVELHGPESAQAAWQTLTAAGYTIRRMQPGYPPVAALEELDWKAYILATPKEI